MTSGKNLPNSFTYNLPYSNEDKKLGMLCTTAGSVSTPPGALYPLNRNGHPAPFRPVMEGRILPEFQLVYVVSGEGTFTSEANSCKVKPGSAMLVLPGLKHAYFPLRESGWREYWVGFKGTYFSRLLDEGILSPEKIFFDIGINDRMLSVFNQIIEEINTQRPFYQMKVSSCVLSLISEVLAKENRKEQAGYYESIVARAKNLMEANVCGNVILSDIYEELGISASRLNDIFMAHLSMTPYQYYISAKIRMAKELLEQKILEIKEVAYRIGFDDQYYFSRLFKSKTGLSPTQWRKKIGQV